MATNCSSRGSGNEAAHALAWLIFLETALGWQRAEVNLFAIIVDRPQDRLLAWPKALVPYSVNLATPREVVDHCFSAVLLGDDMVYLKRQRIERRGSGRGHGTRHPANQYTSCQLLTEETRPR